VAHEKVHWAALLKAIITFQQRNNNKEKHK